MKIFPWWFFLTLFVIVALGAGAIAYETVELHQDRVACARQHGALVDGPGLSTACIERGQH